MKIRQAALSSTFGRSKYDVRRDQDEILKYLARLNFRHCDASLDFVEALFDYTPEISFYVKDVVGRFVRINKTLKTYFGVSCKNDVIGRRDVDYFSDMIVDTYVDNDRQVMQSGMPLLNYLELAPSNKVNDAGWHLSSRFPLYDDKESVVGVIGISQNLYMPLEKFPSCRGLIKAVNYIQDNISESLRMSDIACASQVSPKALANEFKQVFLMTVSEYIQKVRMEKAVSLLRCGRMSLRGVSLDCGYYDQSAFTRKFKEIFGVTPGMYRRLKASKID